MKKIKRINLNVKNTFRTRGGKAALSLLLVVGLVVAMLFAIPFTSASLAASEPETEGQPKPQPTINPLESVEEMVFQGNVPASWRSPEMKMSRAKKRRAGADFARVKSNILSGQNNSSQVQIGDDGRSPRTGFLIRSYGGLSFDKRVAETALGLIRAKYKKRLPLMTIHFLPPCRRGCKYPQNTVTLRNQQFAPQTDIFIRDFNAIQGMYASSTRTKEVALLVHFVGRVLHEKAAGEFYYSLGGGTPGFSRQLSPYATNSKRKFVAEVFTAMVLGERNVAGLDGAVGRFTGPVLSEYRAYRGPMMEITIGSGRGE